MNKTELLTKLAADADERLVLARGMDKLEFTQNRSVPAHTFFLTLARPTWSNWVRRTCATSRRRRT